MIKLSDYLNYLNSEVIQARKKADEEAIKMALEYSKHEYLKFFRVPRFSMPMVKMDIPIKISEINADTKYNFKMNEENFIVDVNKSIKQVNIDKKLNIKPVTIDTINKGEFLKVRKALEKKDHGFVKRIDDSVNKIDFSKVFPFKRTTNEFSTESIIEEREELIQIFKESIIKQHTPVSVKLNDVFIDPDTSKELDKGKILLNLHVVMEDEGIRIVKMKDKEGNEIEEIIFE